MRGILNLSKYLPKKPISKLICILLLGVSLAGQFIPIASALSPQQLKVYQEGINYFDTQVCGDTSSGTSVTSGIGTPTGLQFPALDPASMADAINTYIKNTNPNSELNNLGATIVASAKNANINPFLVVAIAQQESNLSDPSDFNVAHANNSFGRTAAPGQPSYQGAQSWYKWSSVKASVDYNAPENQQGNNSDETQYLVDQYGSYIKNNDLSGLVKQYDPAPSEYQKYIPDVTSWIKQMADMTGSNQGSSSTPSTGGTQASTGGSTGGGGGATIDDSAAQQAAQQASTGNTKVGYALYDASGDLLANYNDTFENYGASITKAMILVAYLNQVGSGTLDASAKAHVTAMIEQSSDSDANAVISLLNNPQSQLQKVAQDAGMTGFNFNITGDSLYWLGQSQITARDFAKFFSKIDLMIPQGQRDFALGLLSNITPQAGLLQAGLPGTVYSKEGWKPEPGGGSDPARSGSANPFGSEGAPWVVNQAAQFSSGGTTYGLAVTVSGASSEADGENIIKNVGSAIATAVQNGGAGSQTSANLQCCPPGSGGTASGNGSIPTSLTGGNNQTQAYNFFLQLGLSPAQAAGVVANLYNESSVNPLVEGPDPSASATFGIAEWTPSSKFTTDKQKNNVQGPDGSLLTQLTVLWYEMNGKSDYWTNILPGLEKISDPGDAAVYFRDNFEKCDLSYSSCADRGSVGQQMYQQLANGGSNGGGTVAPASGCSNPSVSPDCQTATGDAKILCEAKQFDTASYSETIMGGNHLGSNKTWLNQCPTIGPKCYLDCSGLVNIAVYEAFGYDLQENTYAEASDTTHWQHISFNQLQPGDLIQPGQYGGGHVEIVDHVSGNTIYTFGAHTDGVPQPQQVGPASYPKSAGDLYLHWIGPGAS